MSSTESVQQLVTAAEDVTRQLPEAHLLTRRYREPRFRSAADRFVRILYELDVPGLEDDQLVEAERLTRVAINVIETHMLLRYTSHDAAECGYYTDLINRLRDALDALDSGLPTDPSKRPSEEDALSSLASDLARVGIH